MNRPKKPFGLSYRMLEPRRSAPRWGDPKKRERITTDDCIFELCLTTTSDRNNSELMVAWPQRGLWQQAVINKKRIKNREVLV